MLSLPCLSVYGRLFSLLLYSLLDCYSTLAPSQLLTAVSSLLLFSFSPSWFITGTVVSLCHLCTYDVRWCGMVLWRIGKVWTTYWFFFVKRVSDVCAPSGSWTTSCFTLIPLAIAWEACHSWHTTTTDAAITVLPVPLTSWRKSHQLSDLKTEKSNRISASHLVRQSLISSSTYMKGHGEAAQICTVC